MLTVLGYLFPAIDSSILSSIGISKLPMLGHVGLSDEATVAVSVATIFSLLLLSFPGVPCFGLFKFLIWTASPEKLVGSVTSGD